MSRNNRRNESEARDAPSLAHSEALQALGEVRMRTDGCDWFARVGVGPRPKSHAPVVLVHGFGISGDYFVPLAKRIARHADVYAPDLPGHGRSATPDRALQVEELAEALHGWMTAMSIERATVLGHSMGCQIAVELTARYPDVVARLVLVGPTVDVNARDYATLLRRFLAGGGHESLSMVPMLIRDYTRMGPRLLHELRAMKSHRIETQLPRVAVPVLFVRGEHDHIAPQRWLNELAEVTADSRVASIPGGGHAVQYGEADQLMRLIDAFLRGASVSR